MLPLLFVFLALTFYSGKITIPFIPLVIWYEINYGRTILPELICVMQIIAYIMWRLSWWKFMSEIRRPIMGKGNM